MRVLYSGALNDVTGYGADGFGLCQALVRWGCDVYVQPTNVHPPLPPSIAALLTKAIPDHVDLALTHRCPQELAFPANSAPRTTATVSLAWTMWEYASLDNVDYISSNNCEHRPRVTDHLKSGLASYDALLAYDEVSHGALSPYHRDTRILQGGVDTPPRWERDWFGSPFRFLMLGALHAQPLSALVLTPGGWVRMGDLSVGHVVCCPGGGGQKVESVSPCTIADVYEVTFTDRTTAQSTLDHLWVVDRKTERGGFKGDWKTLSLSEIIKRGITQGRNRMFAVPVNSVDYELRSDPGIDPYLMGAFLGDGYSGDGSVSMACVESDLIEEVRRSLPSGVCIVAKPGCKVTWRLLDSCNVCASPKGRYGYSSGTCKDCTDQGLKYIGVGSSARGVMQSLLRSYGVFRLTCPDKFIPADFLYGSREVRLAVLQGLMDTDGWNSHSQVCFSSSSPALVSGVAELVRSLGGVASIGSIRNPKYKYKGEVRSGKPHQQVSFHIPVNPFRLKRKANAWKSPDSFETNVLSKRIASVKKLMSDDVQCITVSGADGTYITDNHTITHNSRKNPMAVVTAFKELKDAGELADAELILKTVVPGFAPQLQDWCPGLTVITQVWTPQRVDRLMASCHALLAPSRGEGKNIPAVRFAASGGAVAATSVGGHSQWLSEQIGWPLRWEWRDSVDGRGAEVDHGHLREVMVALYRDRGEARRRAECAAAALPAMMGWDRVLERLAAILGASERPLAGSRGAEVAALMARARRGRPESTPQGQSRGQLLGHTPGATNAPR